MKDMCHLARCMAAQARAHRLARTNLVNGILTGIDEDLVKLVPGSKSALRHRVTWRSAANSSNDKPYEKFSGALLT